MQLLRFSLRIGGKTEMVAIKKISIFIMLGILISLSMVSQVGDTPPASTSASAQGDYQFETLREYCYVYIEKDGSIHLEYEFIFKDNFGTLDGVDVGMPNSFYSLDSAIATVFIDGIGVSDSIRNSPYIPMGIAVEFAPQGRGSEIQVFFEADNPHMVYDDVKNNDYAGIRFRPTWFSSDYQRGVTWDLQVWVYLPEGLNDPSKIKYLEDNPYSSLEWDDTEGRFVAHWDFGSKYPEDIESGECDVGVSFPEKYVDKHYRYRVWQGIYEGVLMGGSAIIICFPLILIVAIFGGLAYTNYNRRLDYFEPEMSVKGAGPRIGLTAVEAAILLEKPLNMVTTMILYGMVKKNAIRFVSEDPLRLKLLDKNNLTREYELKFEEKALSSKGSIDNDGLLKFLEGLIESVRDKIKGFDYTATKRYYKKIVALAWEEVEKSGTPEIAAENASDKAEWLILDPTYNHRFMFMQNRSWYASTSAGGGAVSSGPNPFVTWSEGFVKSANNISKSVVSNLTSFTQKIVGTTNPLPSGGSGGGFSGGGCACACACACAGGGR